MDPVGEVSMSITGEATVGATLGVGAGLVIAFAASGTVTRLEPVKIGVVSLILGPMMGLLEKLWNLEPLWVLLS